jgi:hypothetical protein
VALELNSVMLLLSEMDSAIAEREPPPRQAGGTPGALEPVSEDGNRSVGSARRPPSGRPAAKAPIARQPSARTGVSDKKGGGAKGGKSKRGAASDASAVLDVSDAADRLTDELTRFFIAAYLPLEATSSAARDRLIELDHELEECRQDVAGYARVRERGICK